MKRRLSALLDAVDRGIEFVVIAAFCGMVLVGGLQVVFRYLFRNSLSWSEEFQKYMHIWIIFLGIPLAYKRGKHIGMNIVFDRLPRMARYVLNLTADILWFALGAVMAFYTIQIMQVAKMQTSPGLGLRMDIVYSCILVGGVYLCLMALKSLVLHIGQGMSAVDSVHDSIKAGGE